MRICLPHKIICIYAVSNLLPFDLVKKFFKNIGIVNGNNKKENKLGLL